MSSLLINLTQIYVSKPTHLFNHKTSRNSASWIFSHLFKKMSFPLLKFNAQLERVDISSGKLTLFLFFLSFVGMWSEETEACRCDLFMWWSLNRFVAWTSVFCTSKMDNILIAITRPNEIRKLNKPLQKKSLNLWDALRKLSTLRGRSRHSLKI